MYFHHARHLKIDGSVFINKRSFAVFAAGSMQDSVSQKA